ncbi:hypothetical protein M2277_000394 [Paenibacillus sp. LBL]|nr:hypothetical protein [Paenibacillus sp. LBL]
MKHCFGFDISKLGDHLYLITLERKSNNEERKWLKLIYVH